MIPSAEYVPSLRFTAASRRRFERHQLLLSPLFNFFLYSSPTLGLHHTCHYQRLIHEATDLSFAEGPRELVLEQVRDGRQDRLLGSPFRRLMGEREPAANGGR